MQATMYVKGLLEMMFEVQSEWIDSFIDDIDSLAAAEGLSTPMQGYNGSATPPSSANTSPRGSTQSQTPSGILPIDANCTSLLKPKHQGTHQH